MLKLGLMILALTAFSACSTKCPPSRPVMPPVVYLQEVPEPKMRGKTNGDLLAWALELREALRLANSDKAALRQWTNPDLTQTSTSP